MDIGRVSLPTPASMPLLEARALRSAGGQDGARAANEAINEQVRRDRAESQREGQRPVRDAERAREAQASLIGRIQFEVVDDAKVMKVLDSKDVLIYQVPSKGQLALVKAMENAERRATVMA